MIKNNTPVLVGCGQVTQKIENPEEAKDPLELMKESSLAAIEDSTVDDLVKHIDTVIAVRFIFDSGGGKRHPLVFTQILQNLLLIN